MLHICRAEDGELFKVYLTLSLLRVRRLMQLLKVNAALRDIERWVSYLCISSILMSEEMGALKVSSKNTRGWTAAQC